MPPIEGICGKLKKMEKEKRRELTANADGGTKLKENWLREEDLSCVNAELTDLRLRELHLFPSFPFQQPPYHIFQHRFVHHSLHCHHHHPPDLPLPPSIINYYYYVLPQNGWKELNKQGFFLSFFLWLLGGQLNEKAKVGEKKEEDK